MRMGDDDVARPARVWVGRTATSRCGLRLSELEKSKHFFLNNFTFIFILISYFVKRNLTIASIGFYGAI